MTSMLATRSLVLLSLLLGTLLWPSSGAQAGSPLSNDPTALAVCQDSIRTATLRLATDARRALSACFTGGIECVSGATDGGERCCRNAGRRCLGRLAKLDKARQRFRTYIENRRCSVVPFTDVVAPEGLGYGALDEACAALAPPAAVADLPSLVACLGRIVVADTGCQIGTRELPRTADALACLALDADLAAASGADLTGCGAPAGPTSTPEATPTPGATEMPTSAPTLAPSPTLTAIRTVTPMATSTPAPGATVTVPTVTTPTATLTALKTVTPIATLTASAAGTPTPQPPTATATPTVTVTRTPTPSVTSTPSGPVCGNNVVEAGESCDDGNIFNCDSCPKNCLTSTAPVACSASTVRHAQRIRLQAPAGAILSGGIVCLDYPAGVVALPGTGNVTSRTSNLSGLVTLNDFNNAVQLTFVANPGAAQVNPTISFDLCTGMTAPLPTAFQCVTKGASNQGTAIDPALVECTPIAIP